MKSSFGEVAAEPRIVEVIERSHMVSGDQPRMIAKLRPAVDHLLHLWMPGARVSPRLLALWHSLDKDPGFTKQWEALVGRIRDQLTLSTINLLGIVTGDRAVIHGQEVTR